jgi:hypothetical protein
MKINKRPEVAMRNITILIILTLALISVAYAGNSNAGKSAYSFLKVGVSAKAQAMGGAFAGLADDIGGLYYNPAGLTTPSYIFAKTAKSYDEYGEGEEVHQETAIKPVAPNRFMATYLNYLLDFQSGYLGYVKNFDEKTAAGISLNYQSYGSFKRFDRQGTELGTFGAYDLAIGLSYSKSVFERFSVGVSGKFITESIDSYNSDALALDLGALYQLEGGRTGIGLAVSNLGAQLKGLSKSHKDPLPLTIDAGFAHHLRGIPLTFAGDLVMPTDNTVYLALGGQFEAFNPFMIRLGWTSAGKDYKTNSNKDGMAGFSGGFGYNIKEYSFDYSYSSYADLGNVHRLTLGADF